MSGCIRWQPLPRRRPIHQHKRSVLRSHWLGPQLSIAPDASVPRVFVEDSQSGSPELLMMDGVIEVAKGEGSGYTERVRERTQLQYEKESAMAQPTSPTILPDHTSLHLVRLETEEQFILAVVATTALEALCPLCQCRSESIHSHYVRRVADLPWAGWAVRLELHVRRFFCPNKECKRRIFTERLPGVVAPYARRTTRLTDLLTLIGFAMGGETGNCLVER